MILENVHVEEVNTALDTSTNRTGKQGIRNYVDLSATGEPNSYADLRNNGTADETGNTLVLGIAKGSSANNVYRKLLTWS